MAMVPTQGPTGCRVADAIRTARSAKPGIVSGRSLVRNSNRSEGLANLNEGDENSRPGSRVRCDGAARAQSLAGPGGAGKEFSVHRAVEGRGGKRWPIAAARGRDTLFGGRSRPGFFDNSLSVHVVSQVALRV